MTIIGTFLGLTASPSGQPVLPSSAKTDLSADITTPGSGVRSALDAAGLGKGVPTDPDLAALVEDPQSQTGAAISGVVGPMVPPLVSDALATDSTVAQAAANAVEGELGKAGIVYGASRADTAPEGYTPSAWRQTTEDGHYLALGYQEDGHLDAFAREIFKEDLLNAKVVDTHPDYARVWLTDDGTNRLIMGWRWDGSVEIPGLALPEATVAKAATVYTDAPYAPGSDVLPVNTDTTRWAIWGSSSAMGLHNELAPRATAHGATLTEGGKSSERAEHIAARLGSAPALFAPANGSLTVPGSGSVVVTSPTFGPYAALKPYAGTWAGVHGTISSTATDITFTRTTAGSPVTLAGPTEMIPDDGINARAALTLLWMGKNNVTLTGGAAKAIALTDQAHDWIAPLHKRVLVLGHFHNTDEPTTSLAYKSVEEINAAHAKRYGQAFVDIKGYLTGSQVWTDTGITPTQTDLAQQASGNKPGSLSLDNAHLNSAADTAVVALIESRLSTLGWI